MSASNKIEKNANYLLGIFLFRNEPMKEEQGKVDARATFVSPIPTYSSKPVTQQPIQRLQVTRHLDPTKPRVIGPADLVTDTNHQNDAKKKANKPTPNHLDPVPRLMLCHQPRHLTSHPTEQLGDHMPIIDRACEGVGAGAFPAR